MGGIKAESAGRGSERGFERGSEWRFVVVVGAGARSTKSTSVSEAGSKIEA